MAKQKNKYMFYVNRNHPQQTGIYKLLHEKKKIPLVKIVECLDKFCAIHIAKDKSHYHLADSVKLKRRTLDWIEVVFDKFLKLVTEQTGVKFKRRPRQRRDSYGDWFQKASMDGSLAYNGVTDDF